VQPEDCAPIVRAFERGDKTVEPLTTQPATIAAGLRVPAPSEGDVVLDRVRSSGGTMLAVTEDEIRAAVKDLATTEGVFACPEGAATIPAAARLAAARDLEGPVVLYNTGAGTKYLDLLG
jgi:threonine synthase